MTELRFQLRWAQSEAENWKMPSGRDRQGKGRIAADQDIKCPPCRGPLAGCSTELSSCHPTIAFRHSCERSAWTSSRKRDRDPLLLGNLTVLRT